MLFLSRRDVESLLDLDRLVDAVAVAMADLSAGRASVPTRIAAQVVEHDALLAAMPAFLPSAPALTTKLVSLYPRNTDRPTHQALICCFDPDTGTALAVMDGAYITATRTAAGSALASRLLAAADAEVVAVLGTGTQARAHAVALARLPNVRRVRITGRDTDRAVALAAELGADGIPAEASPSTEDAVRSAAIVCAATHAERPVFRRHWLRPDAHVNSVGYNASGKGEIDEETIRDAFVVVESRAAALAAPPSGAIELRHAIAAGVIDEDHIRAEIGELVAGAGDRAERNEVTLYKSVGVAVQDAAAAALVLTAARQREVGVQIDL